MATIGFSTMQLSEYDSLKVDDEIFFHTCGKWEKVKVLGLWPGDGCEPVVKFLFLDKDKPVTNLYWWKNIYKQCSVTQPMGYYGKERVIWKG